MRNKRRLSNILSTDRKTLYIVLSIVMVSVLTLTVVYAALSTTLNINGNAEVTAASWDIYLDNIVHNSQSTTSNIPTITNKTTASFSTTLSKPGDFYEFTIDVVNNGSIDAMIDSVTKTPTLTEAQAKYLNYIVEYQNGEAITTKQLVEKNSFVRLKVKVEFRKDILSSDLPETAETLNLSFTVNYIQSDETGTNIKDNGVEKKQLEIVSGAFDTKGSEIAIGDEHFYIINNDGEYITMLAKYNLLVGNKVKNYSLDYEPLENPTGIQDPKALGAEYENNYETNIPWYGTISYSQNMYWSTGSSLKEEYGTKYSAYVYDSNANIYSYIESYKNYLQNLGLEVEEARVIKLEELVSLGCKDTYYSCSSAPSWVYKTSYWTGSAVNDSSLWIVTEDDSLGTGSPMGERTAGIRPVIVTKYNKV